MSEQQDQLEKFLDDALKSYGEAPENEGLEQRILLRVAENARFTRPMRSLMLAISAALIAGIACLSWLVTPKVQTRPESGKTLALKRIEPLRLRAAVPWPAPQAVLKSAINVRKRRKAPATPKRLRFPTPSPLSSEERALVQLATGKTEYIPKELTHFGGPVKPIQITELDVRPLRFGVEY